jgi:hypothetical protein
MLFRVKALKKLPNEYDSTAALLRNDSLDQEIFLHRVIIVSDEDNK